ncbi:MAG: HAD hydrolase-like protein [Patescibacteria group bacterium]|jgi:phosphoglycolate phosphatase-like HAD superfamily hydrolase
MNIKPLILFDLDWTLINVSKLKQALYVLLAAVCKTEASKIEKEFEQYISTLVSRTDFSVEELTEHLTRKYQVPQSAILTAITGTKQIYSSSLYPEVAATVEKLSSKYTLGIFSEGTSLWQKTKVTLSELLPFLNKDRIYIFRRKCDSVSLQQIPDNAFVVDDKIAVCETLQSKTALTPIWLNRKSEESSSTIKTIHNLSELTVILQSE